MVGTGLTHISTLETQIIMYKSAAGLNGQLKLKIEIDCQVLEVDFLRETDLALEHRRGIKLKRTRK